MVMDGRDIGTVIFPDAEVKFFLTAGEAERGRRRWKELSDMGHSVEKGEVREDLRRRDESDSGRAHAPLRRAGDAIEMDSTSLSPAQVLEAMLQAIPLPEDGCSGSE